MGKEDNRVDEWRRVLNNKGDVIEGKKEVKAVWTSYFDLLNKVEGNKKIERKLHLTKCH